MRRLSTTRFGFFFLAALVSWALIPIVEAEHRWVAAALGTLYALLSVLFFFEELSTSRSRGRYR